MKIFDYRAIVMFFPPDLPRLTKYTKKVEFVVQSFAVPIKEENNVRHPKLTGDTLFDELVRHL